MNSKAQTFADSLSFFKIAWDVISVDSVKISVARKFFKRLTCYGAPGWGIQLRVQLLDDLRALRLSPALNYTHLAWNLLQILSPSASAPSPNLCTLTLCLALSNK